MGAGKLEKIIPSMWKLVYYWGAVWPCTPSLASQLYHAMFEDVANEILWKHGLMISLPDISYLTSFLMSILFLSYGEVVTVTRNYEAIDEKVSRIRMMRVYMEFIFPSVFVTWRLLNLDGKKTWLHITPCLNEQIPSWYSVLIQLGYS